MAGEKTPSSARSKTISRDIWISYFFSVMGGLGAYPAATIHPMVEMKSTSNLPPILWFPGVVFFIFGGIIAAFLAGGELVRIDENPEKRGGRGYAILGLVLAACSYLIPLLVKFVL